MSGHFDIPNTLGAFDRIVVLAEKQNEINEDAEAERQARRELLLDQVKAAIDGGDAYATCFFAPLRTERDLNGEYITYPPNLGHLLNESLDVKTAFSFHPVAEFLLNKAGEGDKDAQALLDRMAAVWVEGQL